MRRSPKEDLKSYGLITESPGYGSDFGRLDSEWVVLREKARAVLEGRASFTDRERDRLLALILKEV